MGAGGTCGTDVSLRNIFIKCRNLVDLAVLVKLNKIKQYLKHVLDLQRYLCLLVQLQLKTACKLAEIYKPVGLKSISFAHHGLLDPLADRPNYTARLQKVAFYCFCDDYNYISILQFANAIFNITFLSLIYTS